MLFIWSILCFILLNIFVQVQSFEEISTTEDEVIAITESAIQNTLNKLFSSLKLRNVNQNLHFKHYSMLHDFFYSITLQDRDVNKEIKRLTKVVNIDNSVALFIAQLSEVWSDDNKSDETADAVYVTMFIQTFLERLDRLKEIYGIKNRPSNFNIHQTIKKILTSNDYDCEKGLHDTNETIENNLNDDKTAKYAACNANFINDNITAIEHDNEKNETNSPLSGHDVKLRKRNNNTGYSYNIPVKNDDLWKSSGRRIYLGKRESIKRFPFMASIHIFKKFHCAGSIIKSDLVITSASCLQLAYNNRFFRENPTFLSVMVGNTFNTIGNEVIPIVEIYFHPSYDPKSLKNNLAIMRLQRHIKFRKDEKKVKKIEIDRNASPLPSVTDGITIVGWGARSINNIMESPYKNKLSYAVLNFYPLRECQEIYSKELVSKKNFCAGFFSQGGGACDHDAGGPGISSGILMGVISFGSPLCGTIDAPTVFTKVGFYKNWIDNIMKMKISSRYKTTTEKFNMATTIHMKTSTFKTQPIDEKYKNEMQTYAVNETDQLRQNNEPDKIFKDFLKSIFDSDEIKELEQFQDNEKENETNQTKKSIEILNFLETYEANEADEIHDPREAPETHKSNESHDAHEAPKTHKSNESHDAHKASETHKSNESHDANEAPKTLKSNESQEAHEASETQKSTEIHNFLETFEAGEANENHETHEAIETQKSNEIQNFLETYEAGASDESHDAHKAPETNEADVNNEFHSAQAPNTHEMQDIYAASDVHEPQHTVEVSEAPENHKTYDNLESREAAKTYESRGTHKTSKTTVKYKLIRKATLKTITVPKLKSKTGLKSKSKTVPNSKSKTEQKFKSKPLLRKKSKSKLTTESPSTSKRKVKRKSKSTTKLVRTNKYDTEQSRRPLFTKGMTDESSEIMNTISSKQQNVGSKEDEKLEQTMSQLFNQIKENDLEFKAHRSEPGTGEPSVHFPIKKSTRDDSKRIDNALQSLLDMYKNIHGKKNIDDLYQEEDKESESKNDREVGSNLSQTNEMNNYNGDVISKTEISNENDIIDIEEIKNIETEVSKNIDGEEIENTEHKKIKKVSKIETEDSYNEENFSNKRKEFNNKEEDEMEMNYENNSAMELK